MATTNSGTPVPATSATEITRARMPGPRRLNRLMRVFEKRVLNRAVLLVAGRRHSADYAVLRHVGRRSSRAYATPLVAHPMAGGFLIALPYGADVDWLRNVEAAGRATLRHRGSTYVVGRPEMLAEEVALALLSARMRRTMGRFHIARYVRLWRLEDIPAAAA